MCGERAVPFRRQDVVSAAVTQIIGKKLLCSASYAYISCVEMYPKHGRWVDFEKYPWANETLNVLFSKNAVELQTLKRLLCH